MRSHVGKIVLLCALSDMIPDRRGRRRRIGARRTLSDLRPRGAVPRPRVSRVVRHQCAAPRVQAGPRFDVRGDTVAPPPRDGLAIVLMTLAFTWLNPHVYLDTFLLISTAGAREAGRRAARVRDRRDDRQRRVVPRNRLRCAAAGAVVPQEPWRGACWMARSAAWCCFSRRCSCADRLLRRTGGRSPPVVPRFGAMPEHPRSRPPTCFRPRAVPRQVAPAATKIGS